MSIFTSVNFYRMVLGFFEFPTWKKKWIRKFNLENGKFSLAETTYTNTYRLELVRVYFYSTKIFANLAARSLRIIRFANVCKKERGNTCCITFHIHLNSDLEFLSKRCRKKWITRRIKKPFVLVNSYKLPTMSYFSIAS